MDIHGYESYHLYGNKTKNVRKGRYGGGISIYFKHSLSKYINIVETHQNGIIWLELSKSLFHFNEIVYLCCSYIPPTSSTVIDTNNFDFYDEIESGIERYKSKGKCFIFGDMNSRTSDESDIIDYDKYLDHDLLISYYLKIPKRISQDSIIDNPGNRLLELCRSTSFIIGNSRLHNDLNVGEITFTSDRGNSVVDYLLLHVDDYDNDIIAHFNINEQNEFSDHSGIHFSFSTKKQNNSSNESIQETFLKFDDTKVPIYHDCLASRRDDISTLINRLNHNEDINSVSKSFIDILNDCSYTVFSKIRVNRNNSYNKNVNKSPWFNADCYRARSIFKKARNIFVRNKSSAQLRNEYISAKNSYNKIKRIHKKKYNYNERNNLNNMSKSNPRKFWKNIRKQYTKNIKHAENLITNDLYDHFKTLYSTDPVNNNPNYNQNIVDHDLDNIITISELEKAVFSQNNNKSGGIDTLTSEIFKCSFHEISQFMLKLFNKIFYTGEYPTEWGMGIIVPIHKGGDLENVKNYRGITLINIIAKIYSQVLLNRLTTWSIKHNKIVDNQFGFQKGKSTIDCIFILHSIIAKTLAKRRKLYVAMVDFEKCFDKLERTFIFQKLIQQNVSSKFVRAIQGMYSCVKAAVRYKKQMSSDCFISNVGAKQGDPSSSLLFLFFINDIIHNINSNIDGIVNVDDIQLFMILFADDAALFAETPEALQSMLNDLYSYCQTWNLKVNINKTKIIIFENGRHTTHSFIFNNQQLEVVKSFKYLGICLFKNGHWKRTQQHIAQHSQYSLHKLFIVFNQLDLKTQDKCKLFDSLVGSILNYGADVFGYNECKSIETIHCKFLRKILCVRLSTNLDALYGETGRYPMYIHRKIIMFKYWLKMLKLDNNCILKKTYMMLKHDADNNVTYNGKNNWASQIKNMLNQIGMSDVWLNQFTLNIYIQPIKLRIIDMYKQSWYSKINNSSRLSSYSTHKHEFEMEKYLNVVNTNNRRISLTQFRISAHNLEIEKGRHENINRNERKCKYCTLNQIESEYHFLLVCPKYYDLRKRYFKPYFCRWPTLQKFETLMSTTNIKTLNNLANYLYYAFKERTGT